MEQYKLQQNDWLVRVSDNAQVHTSNDKYQDWIAEGNTPLPADPIPVIIPDLDPAQIRMVLTAAGLRSQVEAAILVADQNTKDMWNHSPKYKRSNTLIIAMATQLGVTSVQLDNLFIQGALL